MEALRRQGTWTRSQNSEWAELEVKSRFAETRAWLLAVVLASLVSVLKLTFKGGHPGTERSGFKAQPFSASGADELMSLHHHTFLSPSSSSVEEGSPLRSVGVWRVT